MGIAKGQPCPETFCVGAIRCFDGPELLAQVKHTATDILQRKCLISLHDGDDQHWGDDDHPGLSDGQMAVIYKKRLSVLDHILEEEQTLSKRRRSTIAKYRKSLIAHLQQSRD